MYNCYDNIRKITLAQKTLNRKVKKLKNRTGLKNWRMAMVVSVVAIIGIAVIFTSMASGPVRSVAEFGAVGNGVADDTIALQTAIDTVSASGTAAKSARVLNLPAGRYKITKPLFIKSYVQLKGTLGQSIIEQAGADPNVYSTIALGNAHPFAFDARHPLDPSGVKQIYTNMPTTTSTFAKDATDITLSNPADVARMQVDEIACVRSQAGLPFGDAASGYDQPDIIQFNKITAISGNTIKFADKNLNTITNPVVCKVEGRDPFSTYVMGRDIPWYAAQSVEVSGITFRGAKSGLDRGLCYECVVKNVNFENSDRPMLLNALVKNTFSDINATYNGRGLEIKMASTQSVFKNINLTYKPADGENTEVWPVDVGERSVDITLDNLRIDDAGSARKVALVSFGDSQRVTLKNSKFDVQSTGGCVGSVPPDPERPCSVFDIRGNYNSGGINFVTEDFTISSNTFNMKVNTRRQLVSMGDRLLRNDATYVVKKIKFKSNRWSGVKVPTNLAYWAINNVENWSLTNEVIRAASTILVSNGSQQPAITNSVCGNSNCQ